MNVFEFNNYKHLIQERISSFPKKGRGVALKLAKFLGVHPTMISQVLNGDKHFSQEQAFRVCEYFGLTDEETRFFMNLLHLERAGTTDLRNYYNQLIEEQKKEASKVSGKFKQEEVLPEKEAAIYYSDWKYSAIRLLSSLPNIRSRQDVAEHLGLPHREATRFIDQLIKSGLLIENKEGLSMSSQIVYLPADSAYLGQHHTNWRLKAINERSPNKKDEMFFTAPLTCSQEDFQKIQLRLLDAIQDVKNVVQESPSEELACLNMDFFKVKAREV